jgi:hypothetical protein
MSDPVEPPEDASFPWEEQEPLPEDAQDGPRQRHDAFTEARKSEFLRVLVKTGCILDACRRTGIGARTVYRHQESDPRFHDHCRAALRMSATPIELTAWQRAVEGVEQEFAVGGEVRVRRRFDGSLLRLLLQGSNPKKYGPRPGFKRKRLLKYERRQMEREIQAETAAREQRWSFDAALVELEKSLSAFDARETPERLAAGWTKSPDGDWIPPGYAPIPGWVPPPPAADGEDEEL